MSDEYETRVVAIKRDLAGEAPISIYTSLGRSPVWFFKWWNRYKSFGLDGLKDQPFKGDDSGV